MTTGTAPPRSRDSVRLVAGLTIAAFLAYFCMYAFRKPFAVGNYADTFFLGTSIKLKTALVVSQLLGYATSKFLGIRWCSEALRSHRAWWLAGCVLVAEAALVAFACVPDNWKVLVMFINGLPLGMVWGFVIGYLEGRRTFEILIAGLSCSFILSSGVVKDVGALLLRSGVSELWMPAATGALFLAPFLFAVWWLECAPEPTPEDIAERSHRVPMQKEERWRFVHLFGPGLIPLILLYLLLTAFRDYRDSYGIEVYQSLGYGSEPGLFSRSEIPVAIGVFAGLMGLTTVRDHRRALIVTFSLMFFGLVLVGVATGLHLHGHLRGFSWMILIGLGSYLAYVPFGAILFDRLVAAARLGGTAVFSIYLADSTAYLGVVAVQLHHDLFMPQISRLDFLRNGSLWLSGIGILLLTASGWLILHRLNRLNRLNEFPVLPSEPKVVVQEIVASSVNACDARD